jgi:hypothetical protein
MTNSYTTRLHRRTLLAGTAATLAGATTAGVAAAKNGNNGKKKNREPLEDTSSTVAYLTYEPGEEGFGFPDDPVEKESFFDDGNIEFDTTELEITTDGERIHHSLPLPGGKPYIIKHESDGLYCPNGAVINFEVEGGEDGILPEGRYRAVVREDVQLYEKGGYLDWSVSRVDLFERPKMEYIGPTLIVIWDEDGKENNEDKSFRTESPVPGEMPDPPDEVLDPDVFLDLKEAAVELMEADEPNPGGN